MKKQTSKRNIKHIDLSRPFIVLKIGKVCRKPYHKRKFLYFERSSLQSQSAFLDTLGEEVRLWDDGSYSLRAPRPGKILDHGGMTFASFEVRDGMVANLDIA